VAGLAPTARPLFGFDFDGLPTYTVPGFVTPPDESRRRPFGRDVEVEVRPHVGVMGVAPREPGRRSSIPPGVFGGNVDNWRFGPGAAMHYPVFHPGALCYLGDPHMAEGDGELSGTAIEASLDVLFQIVLRRDFHFPSPLLETPNYWIVHGFDEDLNVATRNASMDMLELLHGEMGLSRNDAYSLMSVAADFAVTQVVDGRQGAHVRIPRSVFPARG